MQAVILAGGVGSRLRPYTMHIPKPLLPLGDKPVIEIVVRQLAAAGVSDVVVTTGFLGHLLEAYLGDGAAFGTRVRYVREAEPLGTAAPLRAVADLEPEFLVLNGDLLTTIDFRQLLDGHRDSTAAATIAATRRRVDIDYGVVTTTEHGLLADYAEKPSIDYAVSMGIYALDHDALDVVPAEGRFDMPDLVTALRGRGRDVRCEITDVYWQDIGRFDDYQSASADFFAHPEQFLPQR